MFAIIINEQQLMRSNNNNKGDIEMSRIPKVDKDSSIERKTLVFMLNHLKMSISDVLERYNRDPDHMDVDGQIVPAFLMHNVFGSWMQRGIKVRQLMSLLKSLDHTLVVVPVGAKVTVEAKKSRSQSIEAAEADSLTVFVVDDSARFFDVQTFTADRYLQKKPSPSAKKKILRQLEE